MLRTHPQDVQDDFAERVTITPAMAGVWLTNNHIRNRKLNRKKVRDFAQSLRHGRWLCNGESLVLDPEENILDGQHRLAAIVEAQCAMDAYVVFNMPQCVFSTFDQGRGRTVANVFDIMDEKGYTALAAALQIVWRHDYRLLDTNNPANYPSHDELLEFFEDNQALRKSLPVARGYAPILSRGLTVAFHYLFTQANPAIAHRFMQQLASGVDLRQDSPVYHLLERCIRDRASKAKLPRIEIMALIMKAWNAHVLDKPMSVLRWASQSERPEDFPRILGYPPARFRTRSR